MKKPFLCSTCGSTNFRLSADGKGRKNRRCKPCSLRVTENWKRTSMSPLAVAYRERQKKVRSARQIGWYANVRAQILEGYGAMCACCGEKEEAFLTIDHINDDGRKDRYHPLRFYKSVITRGFPAEYRILCQNCNAGRYRNGGQCPHAEQTAAAIRLAFIGKE